jgi:achaete-scute complex protein
MAMTLGQNIHMMSNNCVIVSSNQFLQSKNQQMYGKRPIAPAPLTSNGINQVINVPKKGYKYGQMQYQATQTVSVARRNARERNRVKQVNNGFSHLRQHIPQTIITEMTKGGRGAAKKLSKVDTLKLAVEYIRRLKDVLDENENSGCSSSSVAYSENSQSLSRSEASLSPTPSYSSDVSSSMSYVPNHIQMSHNQIPCKQEPYDNYTEPSTSPVPSYHSEIHHHHQQMYPSASTPYTKPVMHHHQFDNYSPVSADDEELLDAITWWQQQ